MYEWKSEIWACGRPISNAEHTMHNEDYHFSLSFAPAENVVLLSTSPISSRQKLKLFIVHMYENLTTLTYKQMKHK